MALYLFNPYGKMAPLSLYKRLPFILSAHSFYQPTSQISEPFQRYLRLYKNQ
jgi:hypothetical protein